MSTLLTAATAVASVWALLVVTASSLILVVSLRPEVEYGGSTTSPESVEANHWYCSTPFQNSPERDDLNHPTVVWDGGGSGGGGGGDGVMVVVMVVVVVGRVGRHNVT